jgi:Tfp pilus assembly protein PilX
MINNKGMAVFISLTLLFLLSLGTIVILLTAYNYTNITENQIKRLSALTLAESGIHYAYWKIRIAKDDAGNDITYPCTLTPSISVPTGLELRVSIEEDPSTGQKTINSRVTY